jgi:hypothetical protein
MQTKQKIRYAAAFKSDLEEFILPAFEQILDDCPDHLRPTYLASKQTWIFKNGSQIKLVGLDKNRNGLRGNAINIIILDEAGFVASLKYQYETVIIPATAKQKNIKIVVISTPPESPEHYFVELIHKAQDRENGYYLCLTIDDISDLDPDERKRLLEEVGGEFSSNAQREFFCKIQADSSRVVVPQFSRKRHVTTPSVPDDAYYWVAGDIGGVRDKSVFLLCAYDPTIDRICILKELVAEAQTATTEIVKRALEMEGGREIARYIDAPGQLFIDLASTYRYPCFPPEKLKFEQNIHRLQDAFYKDQLQVAETCTFLIRSLEGGLLNNSRTDFERTDKLGHCDALAALVYALRHADRRRVEKPRAPGTFDIARDVNTSPYQGTGNNALTALRGRFGE